MKAKFHLQIKSFIIGFNKLLIIKLLSNQQKAYFASLKSKVSYRA